jgi:hypothetical protein
VALDRVEAPDRAGELAARKVERPPRAHVDQAGQARPDQVGRRGLEHFERGDVGGGEILQRDDAGLGGEDLAAVIGRREVRQAADQHVLRLAALPIDLHARDASRGLGGVEVRKLADVLGDDRVDDLVRVAPDVLRRLKAAAETGDDDGFILGRGLFVGLVRGVEIAGRFLRLWGFVLRGGGRGQQRQDGERGGSQDEGFPAHLRSPLYRPLFGGFHGSTL